MLSAGKTIPTIGTKIAGKYEAAIFLFKKVFELIIINLEN